LRRARQLGKTGDGRRQQHRRQKRRAELQNQAYARSIEPGPIAPHAVEPRLKKDRVPDSPQQATGHRRRNDCRVIELHALPFSEHLALPSTFLSLRLPPQTGRI
jgi:hypothetical protein